MRSTFILVGTGITRAPEKSSHLPERTPAIQQTNLHFSFLLFAGGCHALLRGYVQGLVTLDIHEYVEENQNAVISEEIMEQLLNQMKGSLMSGKCKR